MDLNKKARAFLHEHGTYAIELPADWVVSEKPLSNGNRLIYPPKDLSWDDLLPITQQIDRISKKQ